ncbi:MAG: hypothetical protein VB018_13205 [Lachnospiraceae bacterium]|nr:hypothetical protein [Lachnospiraceae bacterium]
MKPILFNTKMVQAILNGQKTVTRRVVKYPYFVDTHSIPMPMRSAPKGSYVYQQIGEMPYPEYIYDEGDVLWIRETWLKADDGYHYKTDIDLPSESEDIRKKYGYKWRPSIHMPKEAARIFLRVTDIRVEQLQKMYVDDAIAEGAWGGGLPTLPFSLLEQKYPTASCIAIASFAHLWDSTIPKKDLDTYGWSVNPWVWVIEFEKVSNPERQI